MLNYAFDSLIKIRINYLINLAISHLLDTSQYHNNCDSTLDGMLLLLDEDS